MRNVFVLILLAVSLAVAAGGFAPSRSWEDAVIENGGLDTAISSSTAFDTLVNTDSTTLFTNYIIDNRWNYVLAVATITGTSAATAVIQVVIDGLDSDGNFLKRYTVDTLAGATATNVQCELPFYSYIYGHKFQVKLMNITGAQNIINRMYLYKWRPVTIQRNWR